MMLSNKGFLRHFCKPPIENGVFWGSHFLTFLQNFKEHSNLLNYAFLQVNRSEPLLQKYTT
jgi:hypothetical protein